MSAHTCSTPLSWEMLVDYWADDLDEQTANDVEERLFACAACTLQSERIARIAQAFRAQIPPVISEAELAALRARGLVVVENRFLPSVRQEVLFAHATDLLIHRLSGLSLTDAERVEVVVRIESTGTIACEDKFAPFDRERGEVLIACQKHFAGLPPDVVFEVKAHGPSAPTSVAHFYVPHLFER